MVSAGEITDIALLFFIYGLIEEDSDGEFVSEADTKLLERFKADIIETCLEYKDYQKKVMGKVNTITTFVDNIKLHLPVNYSQLAINLFNLAFASNNRQKIPIKDNIKALEAKYHKEILKLIGDSADDEYYSTTDEASFVISLAILSRLGRG